jgi:hypothetical protein
VAILLSYILVMLFLVKKSLAEIKSREIEILELFFLKVNKIPAIVEIMKKYTSHPDVFEDIIYLHKLSIIYNIVSIYDILELNQRIHREFQFLMKLSAKIPELHRD